MTFLKRKNTLLCVCIAFVLCSFQSVLKNHSYSEEHYTIERVNIKEHGLEGNIVVEVYDQSHQPIAHFQSIVTNNGKIIFDVPQKKSKATFFEEGKSICVEIKKEGYIPVKTKPFSTDPEMEYADLIKVTLVKR